MNDSKIKKDKVKSFIFSEFDNPKINSNDILIVRISLKNVVLPFLFMRMKSRLSTKIGIFFIRILAKFPFWLIYLISDALYPLVYYIVQYRKNVVFENLHFAFPEKSDAEITTIAKKYYRHFCDLTMESFKTGGMKEKDFRKRMKLKNPEVVEPFYDLGKSAVILTMHYNNWEWGIFHSEYVRHKILAVYKPLHNEAFDDYMRKTRSRFKTELIKNNQVLRRVLRAEKEKDPVAIWLASDQTPPEYHKFWFRFLNRDAMFYPGPAFISKRFNLPVIFMKIDKTARGKYLTTIELLFEDTENVSEEEIISLYIKKTEEAIREKPEYYLWSHKRWKHQRPEDVPLNN